MDSLEVANGKSSAQGLSREASSPPQMGFFMAQVVLRFFTIVFTAAAIAVMVTAKETVEVFSISFTVRYSYLSAFKFLVGADAVVCGFSMLSLIFVSIFNKGKSNHYFFLYFHDLILMVLSMSACAAATAVGYVGRYGQDKAAWMAVCGNVKMFCDKALASILLSLIGFICLFLLTIMAARNLRASGHLI
ncbi:CASP-like protein 1F2 [Vitis vinifera]|uniref:CASP-like protein n=1 Tax=Vitis vinifera TaxID=29760 RepID=A0A438EC51_VITVI|nr:CASP-like protein 1F2 [Vitis vinifera]